jgi:glycosyltransferase involved in cell wall biosynthesis
MAQQRTRIDTLRTVLGGAHALIAPSDFVGRFHQRCGVDATRIIVARQGVDLPANLPPRRQDTALRIGYLGQVKWHKGVDLVLSAWGRLTGPRARRLTLWGDASGQEEYAARIQTHIAALSCVSWAGAVAGAAVWQVLADIDVVVVPSRWAENSPNIVLEAQAMDLPVVGARIGGIPELVEHGVNGLLFEPDSAEDLARQLQRLLDEPRLLAELAARAVTPKTFDQELDELEAIYARVSAGASLAESLG